MVITQTQRARRTIMPAMASATEFNSASSPMNVELEEADSSQFACPWSTPKLKGVKFPGCEGHTATLVDNKLYVFGGTNERC